MNFFKIIIAFFVIFLGINYSVYAENHDTNQNIVDKAKEINQKIKKQQAEKKENISSEIESAEPLPLNDPFAGDASTGGKRSNLIVAGSEDEREEMSLYNFKLVGIMQGKFQGYVSLINSNGELMTLEINEELSEGVRLVELRRNEAVFEKGEDSFLIINFKNQIKETSGEY
tara:strand:+ start:532 stop:1047 length:516 start_codon:yes stop_codon:yes gene_type:complete